MTTNSLRPGDWLTLGTKALRNTGRSRRHYGTLNASGISYSSTVELVREVLAGTFPATREVF